MFISHQMETYMRVSMASTNFVILVAQNVEWQWQRSVWHLTLIFRVIKAHSTLAKAEVKMS